MIQNLFSIPNMLCKKKPVIFQGVPVIAFQHIFVITPLSNKTEGSIHEKTI